MENTTNRSMENWAMELALKCRSAATAWIASFPNSKEAEELPMIWLNQDGIMGIDYSDYWAGGHLGAIELSEALGEGPNSLHELQASILEACYPG